MVVQKGHCESLSARRCTDIAGSGEHSLNMPASQRDSGSSSSYLMSESRMRQNDEVCNAINEEEYLPAIQTGLVRTQSSPSAFPWHYMTSTTRRTLKLTRIEQKLLDRSETID
jgi:hypothetical protein